MRESQNSVQNESKTIGRYYRIFPVEKPCLSAVRGYGVLAPTTVGTAATTFKKSGAPQSQARPALQQGASEEPRQVLQACRLTYDAVAGIFICLVGKLL
jgi:hypothetical protein